MHFVIALPVQRYEKKLIDRGSHSSFIYTKATNHFMNLSCVNMRKISFRLYFQVRRVHDIQEYSKIIQNLHKNARVNKLYQHSERTQTQSLSTLHQKYFVYLLYGHLQITSSRKIIPFSQRVYVQVCEFLYAYGIHNT